VKRARKKRRVRRPGLACDVCGCRISNVYRTTPRADCIRREHRCAKCKAVFLSFQRKPEIATSGILPFRP
jgi:hypothetical protein